MRLEFLGTGTSQGVPEILCNCDVCKSEDLRDKRFRCSLWITHNDHSIIVDTGPDFRNQCLRSGIPRVDTILYTHTHADHLMGLDDIRPYNKRQGEAIPIYLHPAHQDCFRKAFGYTLNKPCPPLFRPQLALKSFKSNDLLSFSDMTITPIPIQHGDVEIYGFLFSDTNHRIAYLTDCKSIPDSSIDLLRNVDVLILGAIWNVDKQHPGHLTLAESLDLSKEINPGATYLTHITHFMGLHSQTDASLPDSVHLAYDGLILQWLSERPALS